MYEILKKKMSKMFAGMNMKCQVQETDPHLIMKHCNFHLFKDCYKIQG